MPGGTPVELVGPDVRPELERFVAVSTALGDVVVGPPGTTPDAIAARGSGPGMAG